MPTLPLLGGGEEGFVPHSNAPPPLPSAATKYTPPIPPLPQEEHPLSFAIIAQPENWR